MGAVKVDGVWLHILSVDCESFLMVKSEFGPVGKSSTVVFEEVDFSRGMGRYLFSVNYNFSSLHRKHCYYC